MDKIKILTIRDLDAMYCATRGDVSYSGMDFHRLCQRLFIRPLRHFRYNLVVSHASNQWAAMSKVIRLYLPAYLYGVEA